LRKVALFLFGLALLGRALDLETDVATSLGNLAGLYTSQGRYADAESLYRRTLAIREKTLGPDDPDVAASLNKLASVYTDQGRYADAEPLYRQAIAIYIETQSPQHLNTGIGRIKLGRALVGQQRYAEAETELLAGYDILTKQTSPSVSWLRSAREDLVTLYAASDQPEKAKRFQAELVTTTQH